MSAKPQTISDLIDRWETIGKFAEDIGCGYEAARKMRARQSIKPVHWSRVLAAAKCKGIPGVTPDWLTKQSSAQLTTLGL